MSAESEITAKEVFIVKRSTKMDSEDFVSIHLKSPDDSIDELLQKAINATSTSSHEKSDKKVGIL